MGIPLLAGRTFTVEDESTDAPLVGIIDQHMARDLFPGRDPLQAILRVNATRSIRIVGVVKDAAQRFYGRPAADEMYIPFRQYVFGVFMSTMVVRASGDPLAIGPAVQRAIWEVDPEQPIVKQARMNVEVEVRNLLIRRLADRVPQAQPLIGESRRDRP